MRRFYVVVAMMEGSEGRKTNKGSVSLRLHAAEHRDRSRSQVDGTSSGGKPTRPPPHFLDDWTLSERVPASEARV